MKPTYTKEICYDLWRVYDSKGGYAGEATSEALAKLMVESLTSAPYSGKEVQIKKFTDEYAVIDWGRLHGNYVCAEQDELNFDYPMLIVKEADTWGLITHLSPSMIKELREALDSLKED